jgi:chemotaxis protein methyltransferase WspC
LSVARFEGFLKEAIGLDAPSIGSSAVERAVRERLAACEISDLDAYWLLLGSSETERQELIESVVVPETWFFRDRGAFTALARAVSGVSPILSRHTPLRLLSIPCSTGEEPYSMAMALLDAGLDPSRFSIDAVDISARALGHARRARYRKNSFRGEDQSFREKYFDGDRLAGPVRERVQFHQSNLFTAGTVLTGAPYDAVFCRNLLIYFDRETQDRAVAVLTSLLAKDGILFVGPSETGLMLSHGFESRNWSLAFAFRAPRPGEPVPPSAARTPPTPRRKRSAPEVHPVPGRFTFLPSAPPAAKPGALARAKTDSTGLERAHELADQGDIAAARQCCETFIRDRGPTAPAHYLLGLLHDAAGESALAIENYRRAVYLDPRHHEALVHLAILIEQSGDSVAAGRLYDRAKRAAARVNET